jgi:hypothetical protein
MPDRQFRTIPGGKVQDIQRLLRSENPTEQAAAMRRLAPLQVARLMRMWEMGNTGEVRDNYGRLIRDEVGMGDMLGSLVGFQSTDRARDWDRREREFKSRSAYRKRRSTYMDRAARALAEGNHDQVRQIINTAKNDGVTITLPQVHQRRRNLDTPELDRRIRQTPRDIRGRLFDEEELGGGGGTTQRRSARELGQRQPAQR